MNITFGIGLDFKSFDNGMDKPFIRVWDLNIIQGRKNASRSGSAAGRVVGRLLEPVVGNRVTFYLQRQNSTTRSLRSTHPASPAFSLYWICRVPPVGFELVSPSR